MIQNKKDMEQLENYKQEKLTINLLRKEKMDSLVQDHPSEAGCFIYRKIKVE